MVRICTTGGGGGRASVKMEVEKHAVWLRKHGVLTRILVTMIRALFGRQDRIGILVRARKTERQEASSQSPFTVPQ